MKAEATVYKGIDFINVSELPADQQLLLKHSSEPERIKILIDGKIQSNCIQYRHYSQWYSTVYESSIAKVGAEPVKETSIPVKISLVKA